MTYILIPAVMAQISIPIVDLVIPVGILIKEVKAEYIQ